jgi:hypothetical protein
VAGATVSSSSEPQAPAINETPNRTLKTIPARRCVIYSP